MIRTPLVLGGQENTQLLSVKELDPAIGGGRRSDVASGISTRPPASKYRRLPTGDFWAVADSGVESSVVSFVDLLSAGRRGHQLMYEFIFGDPEAFETPYFPQTHYEVKVTGGAGNYSDGRSGITGLLLGRLEAISFSDAKLNYSLISPAIDGHSPLQVIALTGDLAYLPDATFASGREYRCLNLIARAANGRSTVVPLGLLLVAGKDESFYEKDEERHCEIFPETTHTIEHIFEGDVAQLIPASNHSYFSVQISKDPSSRATDNGENVSVMMMTTEHSPAAVSSDLTTSSNSLTMSTYTNSDTLTTYVYAVGSIPEAEEEDSETNSATTRPTTEFRAPITQSTSLTHTSKTEEPFTGTLAFTTIAHVGTGSKIQQSTLPGLEEAFNTSETSLRTTDTAVPTSENKTTAFGSKATGTGVGVKSIIATLLDEACKQAALKPIWALICDLGKTVRGGGQEI